MHKKRFWIIITKIIRSRSNPLYETNSTNGGVDEIWLFVASRCSVYKNRNLISILVQIVNFVYKKEYLNIYLPLYAHTVVKLLPQ